MKTILLTTLLILNCTFAIAGDKTYGDVSATYVSNYDGDTITVNIPTYPAIIGHNIPVRVYGIDTPEIRGSKPEIKELARTAKRLTENLCSNAKQLQLKNMKRDKYFRILAEVFIDGKSLADLLIKNGLARHYDGRIKPDW